MSALLKRLFQNVVGQALLCVRERQTQKDERVRDRDKEMERQKNRERQRGRMGERERKESEGGWWLGTKQLRCSHYLKGLLSNERA